MSGRGRNASQPRLRPDALDHCKIVRREVDLDQPILALLALPVPEREPLARAGVGRLAVGLILHDFWADKWTDGRVGIRFAWD